MGQKIPEFWCVVAQDSGIFFVMTYSLIIDQEFAIKNNLTLVQVSALAAFMTLPLWTNTRIIDGAVWYEYSEEKMTADFPLLFGIPKRCYKNINELEDFGFVLLCKIGKTKYVKFTDKCSLWNKEKSPKTDEKSENGLNEVQNRTKKSPKTDDSPINNIHYNPDIKTNETPAVGGLFSDDPEFQTITVVSPAKERGTSEKLCTFEKSKFYDYKLFSAEFDKPEFKDVDIFWYYSSIADWSASAGKKKHDWIATARNWMRRDMEQGKLRKLQGSCELSEEAKEYLRDMADGL